MYHRVTSSMRVVDVDIALTKPDPFTVELLEDKDTGEFPGAIRIFLHYDRFTQKIDNRNRDN